MVGSSNTDLVARIGRFPSLGESLTGTDFAIGFGGKGANQAVMAARLGAHVSVVTRLGRDAFGEAYLAHYRAEGVDVAGVVLDDEAASGVTSIWVEEASGLNTMAYVPGANGRLSPADVRAAAGRIATADVLICQLEVPHETTLEAMTVAHEALPGGPLVLLNPAPVPPTPVPDALLAAADLLVVNEEEAAHFTGVAVASEAAAFAAARRLSERIGGPAIVTLGARGAVLAEPGAEPHALPAPSVRAVDTTGAGDAFVGCLATLLAEGLPLLEAVERTIRVAARTVERPGAQSSYPTRAEVADLLR